MPEKKQPVADDPRFHHEIWKGPTPASQDERSGIYYVENHNGQCSYAELALDFEIAADLVMKQYLRDDFGNWIAPIAHLVRQCIELRLKALLETITRKGAKPDPTLDHSHSLKRIWGHCRAWLKSKGYNFEDDARLERTEFLFDALHEIDPSGDLFRFGISRQSAFGKQKSYDRVGLRMDVLVPDFEATKGFLSFWETVPLREMIAIELGWKKDELFDPENLPRRAKPTSTKA